jgi:hypothetical protein
VPGCRRGPGSRRGEDTGRARGRGAHHGEVASDEQMTVPTRLPGWRVILGAALLLASGVVALILLVGHHSPSVSPGLSDANPRGLYQMDVDGSHKQPLLKDFRGYWPVYSRDGRSVIFLGQAESGSIGTLFSVLPVAEQIPSSYAAAPTSGLWRPDPQRPLAWSPDRRQLLTVTTATKTANSVTHTTQRLYLATVAGGVIVSRRQLAHIELSDLYGDGIVGVTWSRGGLAYVERLSGQTSLWFAADAQSPPRQVFSGQPAPEMREVALSPDGKRLAFPTPSDQSGMRGVSLLSLGTLTVRTIAASTRPSSSYYGQASGISWSPDGRLLAFSASGQGGTHIYVADVASGKVKQLTASQLYGGQEAQPSFSPDSQRLTYVASRGYYSGDPFPFYP